MIFIQVLTNRNNSTRITYNFSGMLCLNLYSASDFKFGDVWNINLLLQTLQAMHNKTPV